MPDEPLLVAAEPGTVGLAAEWDDMVAALGAGPFVRPAWIEAWARAFLAPAVRRRLMVLTARRGARLVGVLPVLPAVGGGLRSPTNVHTPQFDVVAGDDGVAGALVGALLERRPRRLSLAYLPAGRPGLAAAAAAAGYRTAERTVLRSPAVDVTGDWDGYRSGLRRGLRADLRRCRRRLAERGETAFTVATGPEAAGPVLDELFALEAAGWKGDRRTAMSSRPHTRRFYRAVAEGAAARGALRVVALRLDGRPVAAMLTLEEQGAQYAVKAAYDPAFAAVSPGRLLLEDVVHRAFEERLARVELLGSDEPYKLEWATAVRERVLWQAFGPTIAGRVDRTLSTSGTALARRAGAGRAVARLRTTIGGKPWAR